MSTGTGISYLDATLNFFTGCSSISEGCAHCWAKRMATRLRGRYGYPVDNPFRPTIHPGRLEHLQQCKTPQRIGINFMSDTFHDDFMRMDAETDVIKQLFIAMMRADWHTYYILTKRPENMKKFFDNWIPSDIFKNEPKRDHIWLGVSAENQQAADERIPILLQIPAAVRWVSVEPMLGAMDLSKYLFPYSVGFADHPDDVRWPIKGIVCGAETGPGARPMDLAWARDLRDQCFVAGVPFYMKQVSGKLPIPQDLMVREELSKCHT